MREKKNLYLYPLILSGIVIVIDQVSKFLVLEHIPTFHSSPGDIIKVIGEDFLWFINVSNRGAMFSIAHDTTGVVRGAVLFVLPILLLLYMLKIIIYSSWEKRLRWVAAGIIGGGIGNMIDRFVRSDGVVDFISVKFYGIFGFSRWPTFNVADSAIVISMIFWIIFIIFPNISLKKRSLVHDRT